MMLSMALFPAHEELAVNRRINVSLPEETLKLLERVAPKGDRSRLIDEAVRHYVEGVSRAGLRKRLKEGAVRRAARDLALAEEWFPLKKTMAQPGRVIYPRRGEIYFVSFDPAVGSEIQKTRPALILQNDIANRHSPITIVAALTSQFEEPLYPTEVLITPPEGRLTVASVVLLNQIRSIDRRRLVRRLGTVTQETLERVNRAMQLSLGLIEL